MSKSDSATKGNNHDEKCNANYIGNCYVNVVFITSFVFGIVAVSSIFIIEQCSDNYQKYIVLFIDVFFAFVCVISLIAMFREVSRLHAREFPSDTIERVNDIGKRLQTLENDKNDKEKKLQSLENDKNDIENKLRTLENEKNDIEKTPNLKE